MWPFQLPVAQSRKLLHETTPACSTSVVLLSDPRMSLVSMANSGRISKRPILPCATGRSVSTWAGPCWRAVGRPARWCWDLADPDPSVARSPWRDCTRLRIAGGRAHGSGMVGTGRPEPCSAKRCGLDTHSAPTVGGPGGADQHVAQFAQFSWSGSFVERGGNVLGCASDLVNTIRQVGSVVGRQHHRVSGQRPCLTPVDRRTLLVSPLPARLPAILTAAAHPGVGHISTAPAAWLRVGTTAHACRL